MQTQVEGNRTRIGRDGNVRR